MNNRQKAQQFVDCLLKFDVAGCEAVMHPEFTVLEAEGLPYAGKYIGKPAWWQLFAAIGATWTGFQIELLGIIGEANGTEFAAYAHLTGKSAKTGKPFDTTVFERWQFKDGLLYEIRPHYWDTKALADANTL